MELTGQPQQERDGRQQHEAESRTEHQFLSQRVKPTVTAPQTFPAKAVRCQYDCQSDEGIDDFGVRYQECSGNQKDSEISEQVVFGLVESGK